MRVSLNMNGNNKNDPKNKPRFNNVFRVINLVSDGTLLGP